MIVESGQLEVYTECEGNHFVIEYLNQGSILNYRSFFMEDQMHINVKCVVDSKILYLPLDEMNDLMANHLGFKNKILKY